MMRREEIAPFRADAPSPLHINPSTEMGHREPMTTIAVASIGVRYGVFKRVKVGHKLRDLQAAAYRRVSHGEPG
jgi:hypothetical protein